MASDVLTILCWKWAGNTMGERVEYTADHVNRLASMLKRHLARPYELACVTDDPRGIREDVRIIPAREFWACQKSHQLMAMEKCYRRLKLFDPLAAEWFTGRVVSIDLDVVITGSIDPLFERSEPFVIWGDPCLDNTYCGSLFMLEPGALSYVWADFDAETALMLRKTHGLIGSDQAWLSHVVPDASRWTKRDGVYSFRMDIKSQFVQRQHILRRQMGRAVAERDGGLLKDARIVFFHGLDDPSQIHLYARHNWIKEHWQ